MSGAPFVRAGGVSAEALKDYCPRLEERGPDFGRARRSVEARGRHKSEVEQGGREMGSQKRRLNDFRDLDFRYKMPEQQFREPSWFLQRGQTCKGTVAEGNRVPFPALASTLGHVHYGWHSVRLCM